MSTAEAVTCGVCSETYQPECREPLVLPCGHTFCSPCLTHIRSGDSRFCCPYCRRDLSHLQVEELPVCLPLLDISATFSEFQFTLDSAQCFLRQYELCSQHNDEQRYWCEECDTSLCCLCLYRDHQEGHSVHLAKTFMEHKKQAIKRQVTQLTELTTLQRSVMQRDFRDFIKKIACLFQLEQQVAALAIDIHVACSIDSVLMCERKLKSLQEEQSQFLPTECLAFSEGTQEVQGSVQDASVSTVDIIQQESSPRTEEGLVVGRRCHVKLDCRDGRLLLHSINHTDQHKLHFKLPSEVFLELSIGGRCLGRVYIHLWCHLRRAQQFMLLCLGTMGPSYVGASFSHVAYMRKAKESLCCKEYYSQDGLQCTRELLNDLEWGSTYTVEPRAGLVIPLSKKSDQHGFGICTRGEPGGTFQCPFGEVSSGLEVVKAAVRHVPVGDVTITRCGLVVPDLPS